MRGGKREGAGRKPGPGKKLIPGLKMRSIRMTDEEYKLVKEYIKSLRASKGVLDDELRNI